MIHTKVGWTNSLSLTVPEGFGRGLQHTPYFSTLLYYSLWATILCLLTTSHATRTTIIQLPTVTTSTTTKLRLLVVVGSWNKLISTTSSRVEAVFPRMSINGSTRIQVRMTHRLELHQLWHLGVLST